jgi:hypothetical protein
MKKLIASVALALAALSGVAVTAMSASASTAKSANVSKLPRSLLGVSHIAWTSRTYGHASGHGRGTGKAAGKYATITLSYNAAAVTIYLNKPYRFVKHFKWDSVESIYRYTGGKCLPKPELGC